MKRTIALAAFAVALGFIGVPTTPFHKALDVDVAHASNDLAADHMGAGGHIVRLGGAQYADFITTNGNELNPDPCAVAYGDNYKTDGIWQGDGSVVSILDKYHDCEFNPWN